MTKSTKKKHGVRYTLLTVKIVGQSQKWPSALQAVFAL